MWGAIRKKMYMTVPWIKTIKMKKKKKVEKHWAKGNYTGNTLSLGSVAYTFPTKSKSYWMCLDLGYKNGYI